VKKKITFLINPISGGINKTTFPNLIEKSIDLNLFTYTFRYSTSTENLIQLAKEAVEAGVDCIVAVGGDGTLNIVASAIANTPIKLAVIPMGSGNGLARHMGISMNPSEAIQSINRYQSAKIDAGMANNQFFINVAGAGFDAHVSQKFAEATSRGFISYAKISIGEFARYASEEYELTIDGKTVNHKAFIICVGNGSQYGNNAYISPSAQVNDGFFNITVIKPFRIIDMPVLAFDLFAKRIDKSYLATTYTGNSILLKRLNPGVFNIDGEPIEMERDIYFNMMPSCIDMILP
jgi:YegS/Rv2252/BmrU family lipid kinase